MSLGPHARRPQSFVWTTVLYGILMTHRFQQRCAARRPPRETINKLTGAARGGGSPKWPPAIFVNALPGCAAVACHRNRIFFFFAWPAAKGLGIANIYIWQGEVTWHYMPNGVGCPGEARRLRDGSGSIAVDKWEIDRPNDRGNCFALWRYCYQVRTKANFRYEIQLQKVEACPMISHLSHYHNTSLKSVMDWKMRKKKFGGHLLFEIWISYLNFTLVGIMVVVHRVY